MIASPFSALSSSWSVQHNLFLSDRAWCFALEPNCIWPQKEHTKSPASLHLEDKAHGSQIPGCEICYGWDIAYQLLNQGLGIWGWFCCLVTVKVGTWLVQEGWDVLLLLTSNLQKTRKDSAFGSSSFASCFCPIANLRVQSSVSLILEGKTMLPNAKLTQFWQNSDAHGELGQDTGEDCLISPTSAVSVKDLAEIQRCS